MQRCIHPSPSGLGSSKIEIPDKPLGAATSAITRRPPIARTSPRDAIGTRAESGLRVPNLDVDGGCYPDSFFPALRPANCPLAAFGRTSWTRIALSKRSQTTAMAHHRRLSLDGMFAVSLGRSDNHSRKTWPRNRSTSETGHMVSKRAELSRAPPTCHSCPGNAKPACGPKRASSRQPLCAPPQ